MQAQHWTKAIVQRVMNGTEEIVCHRGTQQYGNQGITGVSACGLAALNFARVVFEKEQESGRDEDFLQAVVAKETVHVRDSNFYFGSSNKRPLGSSEHHRHMCRMVSNTHLDVEILF